MAGLRPTRIPPPVLEVVVRQRAHEGGHITLGHLGKRLEIQHVLPATQHDPLGLQDGVEHLQAIINTVGPVALVTKRARGRRGFPHHRQTCSATKEIHNLFKRGALEGKGDGGLGRFGLGRPVLKRDLIQFGGGQERAADHEPAKEQGCQKTAR